jgi:hypothetical protein
VLAAGDIRPPRQFKLTNTSQYKKAITTSSSTPKMMLANAS